MKVRTKKREDPDLGPEYVYALGQHGDPKAVSFLTRDLRSNGSHATG